MAKYRVNPRLQYESVTIGKTEYKRGEMVKRKNIPELQFLLSSGILVKIEQREQINDIVTVKRNRI